MFIDSFIGYLRAERNYSVHTLRAYKTDLRAFEEYLNGVDESLTVLTADTDIIRGWVVALMDAGKLASTVCRRLSTLRTFYSYLRDEGLVSTNPVLLSSPRRSSSLPAFLRESEMDALIDAVDYGSGFDAVRDRTVIMCLYFTGIRRSELIGLNISDVDIPAGVLKVLGKRSRERAVPFAPELSHAFEEYLVARAAVAPAGQKAFFVSARGERLSSSSLYRMTTDRLSAVSSLKKRSPHVLRHTFATAMLNNGAEIGAVKELLGHKRLATTEIYTHLTFEELKRFYDKAHPRAGK